jgi:ABC-type lipoprotein release transport system permease subunit
VKIWKTAWRNVWRNKRRSLVTVGAMSLALTVMVLYAGLMAGYLRDMERNALDLELGDIQIFAPAYRDDPSIYERIADPEALLEPLGQSGFRATSRLLAWGMAAAEQSSAGVSFRGVDVAQDALVSLVHEQVVEGSWLDPADPHGVVIGRRLARMLEAEPGTELVVLTQGADGATAYDLFRVRGVLGAVGDATDRTGVFMTAETFRELLVVPSGAHQLIVRRPAGIALPVAAEQIRALADGLDVQTWRQLMPTLATMMDSARSVILVMFFIVYIAIGMLILNAMLMAVFERIRELGVLKALGVSPLAILGLMFAESAIQTGLAIAVGLTVATPFLLYLRDTGVHLASLTGMSVMGIALDPVWRAAIEPSTFAQPVTVLVSVVALAVLYPAAKAAWIDPVAAIRHH